MGVCVCVCVCEGIYVQRGEGGCGMCVGLSSVFVWVCVEGGLDVQVCVSLYVCLTVFQVNTMQHRHRLCRNLSVFLKVI